MENDDGLEGAIRDMLRKTRASYIEVAAALPEVVEWLRTMPESTVYRLMMEAGEEGPAAMLDDVARLSEQVAAGLRECREVMAARNAIVVARIRRRCREPGPTE